MRTALLQLGFEQTSTRLPSIVKIILYPFRVIARKIFRQVAHVEVRDFQNILNLPYALVLMSSTPIYFLLI